MCKFKQGVLIRVFILFLGLKLRRQHWFFLGCLCLVLIFALAICVPISTSTSSFNSELMNNPELQQQAVAQLLQEVPLIDGYEKELSSLI